MIPRCLLVLALLFNPVTVLAQIQILGPKPTPVPEQEQEKEKEQEPEPEQEPQQKPEPEPEKKSLTALTIETFGEMAGGVQNIGPLEFSSAVKRNGVPMMCATTNTYNSSGYTTGLTYWQVTFTEDGSEVKSMKNVTGLNHECYGSDLRQYQN